MNTPGGGPPQRVLTPRHKRAFLSFRRKSDLVWFFVCLIMFSGGTAALVLVVLFVGKTREPNPTMVMPPPLAPAAVALPETLPPPPSVAVALPETLPPPPSVAVALPETFPHLPEKPPPVVAKVPAKKPVEKLLRRAFVSRARPLGPTNPPPVPVQKSAVKPAGYFLLPQADPFKTLVDRQAKLRVEPMESMGEPAIQLTYDLSYGEWVQCFVNVRENFSKYSRVQFLFKGEGASYTLEFKLVDSDGTNVGVFWSQQTAKKVWTVVDLPLSDLPYLWGGDSTLELKRLRQVFFAISKKPGDKGGRGRVIIRGIRFS